MTRGTLDLLFSAGGVALAVLLLVLGFVMPTVAYVVGAVLALLSVAGLLHAHQTRHRPAAVVEVNRRQGA